MTGDESTSTITSTIIRSHYCTTLAKLRHIYITMRVPTMMWCVQKFGLAIIIVILLLIRFTSGYSVQDDSLRFTSNNKPLTVNPPKRETPPPLTSHDQALASEQAVYGIQQQADGLHFVSSHNTHPAHSDDDNWQDSVDRPYFPKSHDTLFSFGMDERTIEEMKTRLPETLENYKNPCWFEEVPGYFTYNNSFFHKYYRNGLGQVPHGDWTTTFRNMENRVQFRKRQSKNGRGWRLRCYPYYFVLGFTKAGTTDFCRILHLFPSVFSGVKKEPQYWNKIRTAPTIFPEDGTSQRPSLADYLDLYDAAAEGIRKKTTTVYGEAFHTGIVGDCDPQTVWQLFSWDFMAGNDDRSQPTYKTPHHLFALYPKTKFIVLLRDPVERAFSHYRFFQPVKKDPITTMHDFHNNVNHTMSLLDACTKIKTTRQCIHDRTLVPKAVHAAVTVGLYSTHIREWLTVFPREQFLFIKSEDYFERRETAVMETVDFLGIDLEGKDLSNIEGIGVINVNSGGDTKMRHETERMLRNFYKSYNQDLVNLLDDETFNWGY